MLAAMVGAVGAVYTIQAMDRAAVLSTVRTTMITGAILVGMMLADATSSGDASLLADGTTSLNPSVPDRFKRAQDGVDARVYGVRKRFAPHHQPRGIQDEESPLASA
jgi:hypothetical protein